MSGSLASVLAAFVGFGLLLAFTPCVFPMIPILSGVLAGAGDRLSTGRGFVLSGTYVLAMAAAYGLLGVAAAWSGQNLQAALQTPWALGVMSTIFVVLALSMFGLFDLQLPASWTTRLARGTSGRGGALPGVALLGFGSALKAFLFILFLLFIISRNSRRRRRRYWGVGPWSGWNSGVGPFGSGHGGFGGGFGGFGGGFGGGGGGGFGGFGGGRSGGGGASGGW